MTSFLPKLSNSCGKASDTVGTTPDGAAPVGTGVAFARGAAWAGAVRPAGTGGDGQAPAEQLVRRGRVGRESTDRSHFLLGGHNLFCPWPEAGRDGLRQLYRNLAALPGKLRRAALLAILISAQCGCTRKSRTASMRGCGNDSVLFDITPSRAKPIAQNLQRICAPSVTTAIIAADIQK
jgi:hypothetical protein